MTRSILPAALYALLTLGVLHPAAAQTAAGSAGAGASGAGAASQGQAGAQVGANVGNPSQSAATGSATTSGAGATDDLSPPLDSADTSGANSAPSLDNSATQARDTISNDPTLRNDTLPNNRTMSDITQPHSGANQFDSGFQVNAGQDAGLTIGSITTGSVAAQAGLREGDRIISVDGRTFTTADEFQSFVPQLAGRQTSIIIERNGQQQTISVFYPQTAANSGSDFATGRAWLGVYLDSNFAGNGALVSRVADASPADRAGVRSGDVILSLNGQDVYDYRDLMSRTRQLTPNSSAELAVARGGQITTINSSVGRLQTAAYRGPMTQDDDRMPPPPTGNWSPNGYSSSGDDRIERLERMVEQLHTDVQALRAQLNSR